MAAVDELSVKLNQTASWLADTGSVMLVGVALDALVILLRDLAGAAEQHERHEVAPDADEVVSERYCNDELLAGSLADAILGSV